MNRTTSHLDIYRYLNSQTLMSVGKIQSLIDEDDVSASDELYLLLKEIEDLLRRNKFTQFMEIAKYRGKLLATQIAIDRRIPRKKHQLEAASALIPTITKTVHDVMKPIEESIDEIRKTLNEMLTEAHDKKMVQWNEGLNFTEFIHALWRLFTNHEEFKDKANPILEIISQNDALEILAEEVNKRKVVTR